MHKPFVKHLLVILSIITCLMATLGHGEGMVLCVGEDGHANVETSTNGVCDPCVAASVPAAPMIMDTAHALLCFAQSRGCMDISLAVEMTPQRTSVNSSSFPRVFLAHSQAAISGILFRIHSPENDTFTLTTLPESESLLPCDTFSPVLRI